MKTAKKVVLRSSLLAVAVAAAGVSVPALADLSATIAGSNMYLWRGQAISGDNPQISGSLDFKHGSGVFAGIWGSSEGPFDASSETDIYAGYAGKAGDFSYGVTLWQYIYPSKDSSVQLSGEDNGGGVSNPAEWQLSGGWGPVSGSVLVDMNDSGNQYYTLGYTYDKFSAVFGFWELNEASDAEVAEYAHVDLFFQATPELKFGLSVVTDPAEADKDKGQELGGLIANSYETETSFNQDKDPLFYVSYAKTFDL